MSKKNTGKFASKKKKSHKGLVTVLVIFLLLLVALLAMMLLGLRDKETAPAATEAQTAVTEPLPLK